MNSVAPEYNRIMDRMACIRSWYIVYWWNKSLFFFL